MYFEVEALYKWKQAHYIQPQLRFITFLLTADASLFSFLANQTSRCLIIINYCELSLCKYENLRDFLKKGLTVKHSHWVELEIAFFK